MKPTSSSADPFSGNGRKPAHETPCQGGLSRWTARKVTLTVVATAGLVAGLVAGGFWLFAHVWGSGLSDQTSREMEFLRGQRILKGLPGWKRTSYGEGLTYIDGTLHPRSAPSIVVTWQAPTAMTTTRAQLLKTYAGVYGEPESKRPAEREAVRWKVSGPSNIDATAILFFSEPDLGVTVVILDLSA